MVAATLHFILKLKGKRFTNDAVHLCFKICGILISLILHSTLILHVYGNNTTVGASGQLEEIRFKLKQYTKEWVDRVCDDAQMGEQCQKDWDQNRAVFELEVTN